VFFAGQPPLNGRVSPGAVLEPAGLEAGLVKRPGRFRLMPATRQQGQLEGDRARRRVADVGTGRSRVAETPGPPARAAGGLSHRRILEDRLIGLGNAHADGPCGESMRHGAPPVSGEASVAARVAGWSATPAPRLRRNVRAVGVVSRPWPWSAWLQPSRRRRAHRHSSGRSWQHVADAQRSQRRTLAGLRHPCRSSSGCVGVLPHAKKVRTRSG
jgi:hypothetical protein